MLHSTTTNDLYSTICEVWPDVYLYGKQREIAWSVEDDDETVVVAGNELGKDFTAGLVIWAFLITRHPCRIITTSAKDDHLDALWGEIGRFARTAKYPLLRDRGGAFVLNSREITRIDQKTGEKCPLTYCKGMVAGPNTEAAMQGHHIATVGPGVGFICCREYIDWPQARTLFVSDESSSVPHNYYKLIDTWAKRKYIFGNPWPCDNFFRHAVKGKPGTPDKGGNVLAPDGDRYYRKVIRIRAEDSPNVRYGLAELKAGLTPTNRTIVPGVKDYARYAKHRKTWDKIQQCVSLDADFYDGDEVKLFPSSWLEDARRRGRFLPRDQRRVAEGVGIDTGEGVSQTSFAAVDALGPFKRVNVKTPDTNEIVGLALAFFQQVGVTKERADRVCCDRGGGGKQLADRLRAKGWPVRTIGFGDSVSQEPKRGVVPFRDKVETREDRYVYKNRRAEMWGELSIRFDPTEDRPWSFTSEDDLTVLLSELTPVPKKYDPEGRLVLLPKNKKEQDSEEPTLTELIGHSPDEADALALACYAYRVKATRPLATTIK